MHSPSMIPSSAPADPRPPVQVCVAGWSMGGIHACMIAAFSRFPVACAAMLPPRSAAAAYSDGALSEFVDFAALRSGRDSTGAPVLPTVLRMLRRRPPYPNHPLILERPRAPHSVPGAHADGAAAGGSERSARSGFGRDGTGATGDGRTVVDMIEGHGGGGVVDHHIHGGPDSAGGLLPPLEVPPSALHPAGSPPLHFAAALANPYRMRVNA